LLGHSFQTAYPLLPLFICFILCRLCFMFFHDIFIITQGRKWNVVNVIRILTFGF
jgi:hypothetical protein